MSKRSAEYEAALRRYIECVRETEERISRMPNYEGYGYSYSDSVLERKKPANSEPKPVHAEPEPEGINVLPAPRTNDATRRRFEAHLNECHRLGYIDQPEYDKRLEAGREAKTRWLLERMLADLPPLPEPDAEQEARKLTVRARKFWTGHQASPAFRYPLWCAMLVASVLLIVAGASEATVKHVGTVRTVLTVGLPVTAGVICLLGVIIWAIVWSADKYDW